MARLWVIRGAMLGPVIASACSTDSGYVFGGDTEAGAAGDASGGAGDGGDTSRGGASGGPDGPNAGSGGEGLTPAMAGAAGAPNTGGASTGAGGTPDEGTGGAEPNPSGGVAGLPDETGGVGGAGPVDGGEPSAVGGAGGVPGGGTGGVVATGGNGTGGTEPVGCDEALTECGSDCVDLTTDDEHCGACNYECSSGFDCQHGVCSNPCADLLFCDDLSVGPGPWTATAGDWSWVYDEGPAVEGSGSGTFFTLVANSNFSGRVTFDAYVKVADVMANGGGGVVVRWESASRYYGVVYEPGGSARLVGSVSGGTGTCGEVDLPNGWDGADFNPMRLIVSDEGGSVRIRANFGASASLHNCLVSSNPITSGAVGLIVQNGTALFQSLAVYD